MAETFTSCGHREPLEDIAMSIGGPWQQVPWRVENGERRGQLFTKTVHSPPPASDASDRVTACGRNLERAYRAVKALKELMRDIAGARKLGGALQLKPGQRLVFCRPITMQPVTSAIYVLYAEVLAEDA